MNEQEVIAKAKIAILNEQKKEIQTSRSIKSINSNEEDFLKKFPDLRSLKIDTEHPWVVKDGSKWYVGFNLIIPPQLVISPSSIRVEIDDLTGEATIPFQF